MVRKVRKMYKGQIYKLPDVMWEMIETGENKYIFVDVEKRLKTGECRFQSIGHTLYTETDYCVNCDDGDWGNPCGTEFYGEEGYEDGKVSRSVKTHHSSKSKKCGDEGIFENCEDIKVFGKRHITLVGANSIPESGVIYNTVKADFIDKGIDFLVYKIDKK